eukprot:SAG11_NODE_919_length_6545_cov_5.571052_6_plen_146_part_00
MSTNFCDACIPAHIYQFVVLKYSTQDHDEGSPELADYYYHYGDILLCNIEATGDVFGSGAGGGDSQDDQENIGRWPYRLCLSRSPRRKPITASVCRTFGGCALSLPDRVRRSTVSCQQRGASRCRLRCGTNPSDFESFRLEQVLF